MSTQFWELFAFLAIRNQAAPPEGSDEYVHSDRRREFTGEKQRSRRQASGDKRKKEQKKTCL
jgi:hypothetical protein